MKVVSRGGGYSWFWGDNPSLVWEKEQGVQNCHFGGNPNSQILRREPTYSLDTFGGGGVWGFGGVPKWPVLPKHRKSFRKWGRRNPTHPGYTPKTAKTGPFFKFGAGKCPGSPFFCPISLCGTLQKYPNR
jgi:hypothetical protein